MSYDVHIVRTDNWWDADQDPITKDEVDVLIASDAELNWSATDWTDMSDEQGNVIRYFSIAWKGEPFCWWYRHEIRCVWPGEDRLAKMVAIAKVLRARVVGDEGEEYR
ncbi:MAG: hypothetical protein IAF94_04975 [Pirellulaceae bacterium]|nr:hypothetical protein [Pirellulaceae bacterium]